MRCLDIVKIFLHRHTHIRIRGGREGGDFAHLLTPVGLDSEDTAESDTESDSLSYQAIASGVVAQTFTQRSQAATTNATHTSSQSPIHGRESRITVPTFW